MVICCGACVSWVSYGGYYGVVDFCFSGCVIGVVVVL